jgi:hypothetical protein
LFGLARKRCCVRLCCHLVVPTRLRCVVSEAGSRPESSRLAPVTSVIGGTLAGCCRVISRGHVLGHCVACERPLVFSRERSVSLCVIPCGWFFFVAVLGRDRSRGWARLGAT